MIFEAVRADVICLERMIVEQFLEVDMNCDLCGFLRRFGN